MTEGEKEHGSRLTALEEVYLQPIIKSSYAVHSTFMKTITWQIDTLINVHRKFISMMEYGEKNAEEDRLLFGKSLARTSCPSSRRTLSRNTRRTLSPSHRL